MRPFDASIWRRLFGVRRSAVPILKLSMHPDLPGDQADVISACANKHPRFPQESTLDQYFQPAQFKAYRELGYAIAQTLPLDIADDRPNNKNIGL